MVDQNFDREKLHINLARLKTHGIVFEVVIDPDNAFRFMQGKKVDVKDIIKAEDIYADAHKGTLASETDLKNVFHTTDAVKIAERILHEGEVQLSAEQRQQIREEKYNKIVDTISRNAIDPRTNTPHPRQRIVNVLDEVKFHVRESASVEQNVSDAMKLIKPALPIRLDVFTYSVSVDPKYSNAVLSYCKSIGSTAGENYSGDGSLSFEAEFPAGMLNEFTDKLNSLTHGSVDIRKKEK